MNARRSLLIALGASMLSVSFQVAAFDPLGAQSTISSAASAGMIEGDRPCTWGPLGIPLTLLEAVERGLCHSPKTREAWADVKAKAAAVGTARAAYLPTVSANWQGARDNSATNVNNFPNLSSHSAATVQSESVSLNWVLFDFGARSDAVKNASALYAAAQAVQNATLQTEFATVAKDYYAVQAAQGALDAAQKIEQMAQLTATAAQARVDRGVVPVTDALQAQTQHDEAVFNVTKAEGDLQAALGTLASDIGLDPDARLVVPVVEARALRTPDYAEPVAQLIDNVKREHPSVLAAQAQYEAATAKIAQTRSQGLPSISLVGKYSRDNQPTSLGLGYPTYPATGHDAYIGVQVTIPLFEGFGRHYQVEQARAEAERQQDVVDEALQQVALDVWTSWQALQTATKNVAHSETTLTNAERSFDAAQHRYEHGVGNILELLNTQTALANAQQRRVQALTDWHTAKIQLAFKLGRLELDDVRGQ
ncbi:Fis family transcriptional regulator [Burkholderia territorii]|uniref:TolC family protein n=1 Tax=Burkholderia territorii TaxID=1503055 RepID=UPI0007579D31|nr:TolC family protein [Burkholderia territorii]KUY85246.1 Fis family transcriptional regulator [Burkholderia territorii]KUZ07315.1 Fis family transcriptional regulator [Burkholderia territorii]